MSSSDLLLALFAKNIVRENLVLDILPEVLKYLVLISDRYVADRLLDDMRRYYAYHRRDHRVFEPIPAGSMLSVTSRGSVVMVQLQFAGEGHPECTDFHPESILRKRGVQTLPRLIRFD